MEPKFCVNCGSPLEEKAKVCPKCNRIVFRLKEHNIPGIISIVVSVIGIITLILAIIFIKDKNLSELFETSLLLTGVLGLILSLYSLLMISTYKNKYKGLVIVALVFSTISLSSTFIIRATRPISNEDCCGTLNTTIDWNADNGSTSIYN